MFRVPEPIKLAHAVVLIGGLDETYRAANWARIEKKPILPVTRYGGAAERIYYEELHTFDSGYAGSLAMNEFENLNQTRSEVHEFARTVVSIAEKAQPKLGLIIMSYSETPDLKAAKESYAVVCQEYGFEGLRIDEMKNVTHILPLIRSKIASAAFTIVDISEGTPNVYFEAGYAEALQKPLIVTAKEGSKPAFDIADIPIIFWKDQEELTKKLRKRIEEITV